MNRKGMIMSRHFFIAVPLPSDIKAALKVKCEEMKTDFHFKRWVHQEDYHITLAFLGHADEEQLLAVMDETRKNLRNVPPFELNIQGFNTFGRKEYPRILWVNLLESQPLNLVREIVYRDCMKAGFELDKKPFTPHITVARKWDEACGEISFNALLEENFQLPKFLVEEVVLYESKIEETPKYYKKAVIRLDGQ
ncbi:RNA 2',3'-cyclic phosphodiesterase [Lysinibacillus sp. CNPSo 3705]|uniref:RNA 2',3'-cyclic phosphodiesterase n=1 Tax=Lysinibacillus sp. CNPSo 3705 TaxID=3028148 RepID=UPI0010478CB4|nr:RNA 2',3'-cyclic phosphodiesterase [Lysinibacillus sp. CNPSo 3705]MDD1502888.1 RNA 2',3'-cyclic phosphodiesterase [Lysinibacillus sp. CNPSo 3705]